MIFPEQPGAFQKLREETFAACSEAGIKILRICQEYDKDLGFHKNIGAIKQKYDSILPLCDKYGVSVGVQMHCGWNVFSAAELYLLIKDYDPKHICAVWDSGHNGLSGTEPEISLDTLWDNIGMINFKSAYYKKEADSSLSGEALWTEYWTTGKDGTANWKRAVNYIMQRDYSGYICLCAEYSDEENAMKYSADDLSYIKELFNI